MTRTLLLLCLALLTFFSYGQNQPATFQRYSSKDGLSSNTIYSIYRDGDGFLWLGTEDGLNRFDGRHYNVYRYDADKENSLMANHISALCEDKKGRIWIGTNGGGLSYYDREADRIRSYNLTPDGKWLSTAINAIDKDADGNIWIASYGALSILDVNDLQKKSDPKYKYVIQTFAGKVTSCVFRDRQNNMWVSSENAVFRISKDLKTVKRFEVLSEQEGYGNGIEMTSIIEDDKGRIWIGSMLGLKYLNPGELHFNKFIAQQGKGNLSSPRIYTMCYSEKQGLWIGTDNGLDVLNTKDLTIRTFRPDPSNVHSLSHKSIRSIFADNSGIYWIGTFQGGLNKYDTNLSQFRLKSLDFLEGMTGDPAMITSFAAYQNKIFLGVDGGGVWQYDRKTDGISSVKLSASLPSDLTVLALERKLDQLWIGTYQQGVLCYDLMTGSLKRYTAGTKEINLNNNDVFCLKSDFEGNVWVGTNGGGINVIQKGTGIVKKYRRDDGGVDGVQLPGNFIRALEEDQSHHMWIGTYGAGLVMYNPLTKRTTTFDKAHNKLPSNYILAVHSDKNGNLWVGTNGNGVGILRKGKTQFETLSEKDGLANGAIQSIVEDDKGRMWFSTNKGLSCYAPSENKFKNYSNAVGLQEGAFMLGASLKTADGEIYFGGQKGFNHFYPAHLKTNSNPAKVALTDLKIDNVSIQPADKGPIQQSLLTADRIQLKYKQNFSISFAALNLTVPEDNQYEYRLVGFDKNWIRNGKENNAYYTNLDPGDYIFQVRASNNDGIWNKEIKSIAIHVAPPFWRTVYAYIFYVLAIAGTLWWMRHRGIQKLKQKFAIEQERIEAKQLIEQQRRDAETKHQLDAMKIKFLTNLSHEFRTPISLIMGPIDALVSKNKDSKLGDQLALIRRNARRLLNLVNQLLDFRKMEYHELKLQDEDGELVSFVQETYRSFQDMALQKGIDYSFLPCQEKVYCRFDRNKVERILFNLIYNAFKFTKKGGDIAVSISSVNMADQKIHVYLEVRDTGIGIPQQLHESIFESFFQYDNDGKVASQGSGIGLSIAQSFVQMYNGKIAVDSQPAKGSVFTFDLWLDPAEQDHEIPFEQEIITSAEPIEVRQNPLVLIIEDDEDFRYYLKESLSEYYQIIEATNGKDGWQKALFHHPDLVVSDVQMPYLNGMEFSQKLAQDKRTKHIPVVLLTASQVDNGLVCGLESGAVGYLTKPFDMQVLVAKVNSLLQLNQAFKEVYSKQVSIVAPELTVVSEKDKFLQKVLNYVHDNIDNPQLSVEALSSHTSMSRASLYNKLLELTGMSPVDFIRSVKLEKAASLLEKSDKSISEIAYETGFANPNYFTKVFKAKYQMTPSEYIHSQKCTSI
ncbi:ATP-binding protein [Sphingobacterium sp. ML3W]|uniref:hybrid sensor histidine kinase/response regulator transcription factor n=1 Tax=Sphingobacterium sp. ML3W TaxID=1538644 RepID=UPI00249AF8AD|nr:hybrid sensor histidine kinase/response regulator transcription factor [Sphingobacterium sp. ML3W]WFA80816.1 ATP-binding protein [Sphingobacterium sp. ML3W]